ncbi:MAG: hypothetical protein IPI66_11565 [Chitinophagaceae bacterium]|nr:hypothetical protein [Chitinophagaceae bacterium]
MATNGGDQQRGHIVTYGVPGLIGWETGSGGWGPTNNYDIYCWKLDFAGYWSTVNAYPNSFCTLAHPQTGDYSDLAGAAPYSASADTAIAGIAIRSGSATSTTSNYGDPAPTLYESVYLTALAKGYHLGPTADQDNHYTTFGRNNRIRTVVLATQLKRDSILAAYRAMRFYASDDWNTEVTFTVNGHYMGSDFSTNSNSSVFVSVNDPDAPGDPNDNISKIELFYGTPGSNINATPAHSNTNSTTLSFNHPTIATNNYYYFAKITQVDGDMMWTAPIWVYRSTVPLPLDLTRFSAVADQGQVRLNWTTAQEINLDRFEIERSTDGSFFQQIGFVPSRHHSTSLPTDYDFYDAAPNHSINFYRLKQIGQDGNYRYSDVVAVRFSKPLISIVSINPNPVINWLNIKCVALESIQVTAGYLTVQGDRYINSTRRYRRAQIISQGIYPYFRQELISWN